MWVETQVPCMIYCGDDLCNCSARWYYEEEEDWSIADKKEQSESVAYKNYLKKLRDYSLNPHLGVDQEQSKVISTLEALTTGFASKSKTTQSLL